MKNIDWKVLGFVIWGIAKVLGSITIGIVLFGLAVVYFEAWVLIGLLFLTVLAWWVMIEYKTEMFKRGIK